MSKPKNSLSFIDMSLDVLRKHQFRITSTRKLVLEGICRLQDGFNVKSLHEDIEAYTKKKFDFATVFRVVSTLHDLGLVHQSPGTKEYIPCSHKACMEFVHILYICRECKGTKEGHLPRELDETLAKTISSGSEFKSESAVLNITGVCKDCA